MQTDEILDLVNERDEVIEQMPRSVVYAQGRNNFRVVNAFLRKPSGEVWIPRRAANKRIFPLCLDMSMGGHVETGEGYDTTFAREMAEELNIDVTRVEWRVLGNLTPMQHGVSAFMRVYELIVAEAPAYNPSDFVEYYWLQPQELLAQIRAGEKSKGDLPKLVEYFYGNK